jgi:hypothetical protein
MSRSKRAIEFAAKETVFQLQQSATAGGSELEADFLR